MPSWGDRNRDQSNNNLLGKVVKIRKLYVESSIDLHGSHWVFDGILICKCVKENYARSGGKNSKEKEAKQFWSSHKTGNNLSSHQSEWKDFIIHAHQVEFSVGHHLSSRAKLVPG